MEDDLNILANVRGPQYLVKWKTTSIFSQMENDLNILANGRRLQYFGKWKTTSIFWKIEDDLSQHIETKPKFIKIYINVTYLNST